MGCCPSSPLQYPPDIPQDIKIIVHKTVIAGPAFVVQNKQLLKCGNGTFMITNQGIFYYNSCMNYRFIGMPLSNIQEIFVTKHFEYKSGLNYAYMKPCGCTGCHNACAVNSFIQFKCDLEGRDVLCAFGVVDAQDLMDDIRQYIPKLAI